MRPLLTILVLLPFLGACIGPSGRRRRPMFGQSDPQPKRPKLTVGPEAKEQAASNAATTKTSRREPKRNRLRSARSILDALEQAAASARPGLLARLAKAKPAELRVELERRQAQRQCDVELYEELLARMPRAKGARPAPERRGPLRTLLRARYRQASDAYLAGDYLGALRITNALLVLAPDDLLAPRIKRLRQSIRGRLMRETVLHTEILSPSVLGNRPVTVLVRLTNRSRQAIFIQPPREGPPNIGKLELSYEELRPGGSVTRSQTSFPIRESRSLSIRPGQKVDIEVTLPFAHAKKPKGVLGRYTISGHLRPFQLTRGRETLPYLVPLFPTHVYAVDRRDLILMRHPTASLLDALDGLDLLLRFRGIRLKHPAAVFAPEKLPRVSELSRRVFVAAILAGQLKRTETLAILEENLRHAPSNLAKTLCSALSRITGDPFNYSKAEWLEWLLRTRAGRSERPKPKKQKPVTKTGTTLGLDRRG